MTDGNLLEQNAMTTTNALYETTYTIRTFDVDANGFVRPVTLLGFLQEAASEHMMLLGGSVRALMAEGLTWVLSRVHLRIERYPRRGHEVTVRTWPSLREGRFTCREFELFDQTGTVVARATTSWAVIDFKTRRPVRVDRHPPYPLMPRRVIDDDFGSLPVLGDSQTEERFRVRRSDLDLNRHVNHMVYVGWALDAVSEEVAETLMPVSLEIGYRAEALAGEEVTVSSSCTEDDDGTLVIHRIASADGRELTRLRTRWRRQPATTAQQS